MFTYTEDFRVATLMDPGPRDGPSNEFDRGRRVLLPRLPADEPLDINVIFFAIVNTPQPGAQEKYW